jgi:hypothetical protein
MSTNNAHQQHQAIRAILACRLALTDYPTGWIKDALARYPRRLITYSRRITFPVLVGSAVGGWVGDGDDSDTFFFVKDMLTTGKCPPTTGIVFQTFN